MTTTSVKDVGSVMNLGAASGNTVNKANGNSFQNVWSTQTSKGKTEEQPGAEVKAKEPGKSNETAKPGEELKAADRGSISSNDSAGAKEASPKADEKPEMPEEMPEEKLEEAMEVIATAVVELIRQIADTFRMPVEEVQQLVTELNLQPVDLLQPENLSNLLLEAGGAQDSLALLTDEKLYADFQSVMEQGKVIADRTAETIQVPVEQIGKIVEAAPEIAAQTEIPEQKVTETPKEQPVVEMTVQTAQTVNTEKPEAQTRPVEREGEEEEPLEIRSEAPDNSSLQTTATKEQDAPEDSASGNKQQGSRGHSEHSRPESAPVFQTIRNENFQPQMENVQETARVWDTDTQDLMRQIMDYMRVQVKPGLSNLEMQLHPASLGTLQVQVASKGGVLTANFVTQNEAVKAALESQMIQLKESFEQQGVKVEAIEVTVQTHQFEENLEQGRGRQPQESGERRNRTRRINLEGLDDLNGAEELTEADRLAAEMMAAGGGTVDYTA